MTVEVQLEEDRPRLLAPREMAEEPAADVEWGDDRPAWAVLGDVVVECELGGVSLKLPPSVRDRILDPVGGAPGNKQSNQMIFNQFDVTAQYQAPTLANEKPTEKNVFVKFVAKEDPKISHVWSSHAAGHQLVGRRFYLYIVRVSLEPQAPAALLLARNITGRLRELCVHRPWTMLSRSSSRRRVASCSYAAFYRENRIIGRNTGRTTGNTRPRFSLPSRTAVIRFRQSL